MAALGGRRERGDRTRHALAVSSRREGKREAETRGSRGEFRVKGLDGLRCWAAGGRLGLLLSPPYFLITDKKEKGRKEKVRERVWACGLFSPAHKIMKNLEKMA